MPPEVYDPYSVNAMFSRIIERLDQQDVATAKHREEMKAHFMTAKEDAVSAEERITALERAQWRQRGFVAAIALAVPLLWEWISGIKH